MIWNNFDDIQLTTDEYRLIKLFKSDEWEDIKKITGVYRQMALEDLSEATDDEILKTQGRISVLSDIIEQIEQTVNDLSNVNFARELDEYEENNLLEED